MFPWFKKKGNKWQQKHKENWPKTSVYAISYFFYFKYQYWPRIYLFIFLSLWSFFSDICWHISKKKRRAHLSPRACGFKHFCACNLGLVCLIVIGLVRRCVSRAGSLSFSSVLSRRQFFVSYASEAAAESCSVFPGGSATSLRGPPDTQLTLLLTPSALWD